MFENGFGMMRTAQANSLYRGTFIPEYDAVINARNWNIFHFDATQWEDKMYADTGATIQASDGSAVARWNAGSSASRHQYVSQSSASLMPTLDVDAFGTGKAGVVFAGDWLRNDLGAASTNITDFWLFAVFKANWVSNSDTVIGSHNLAAGASWTGTAANRMSLEYFGSGTNHYFYYQNRQFNLFSTYDYLNDGTMLCKVRNRQTATADLKAFINDIEAATTNGGAGTPPTLTGWDARTVALGALPHSGSGAQRQADDLTLGGVWCTTEILTLQQEAELTAAFYEKFGIS